MSDRPLTEKELQILRVLWKAECAMTVKEICGRLKNGDSYSTVQTTMSRMITKRLLIKGKDGKAIRFSAVAPSASTKGSLLGRFLSTVFGGSAQSLVTELLDHGHLTAAQLEELNAEVKRKKRSSAVGDEE